MKNFEELIDDLESADTDLNGVLISDYEIGMRLKCFFNGLEVGKKLAKKIARDKRKKSIFMIDGELKEYHERRVLNGHDIHKRKMTQATKDKISKSLKATSEREGWKGIPLFEETKIKIGLIHKGKIVSQGTREKVRLANTGKKRTEEQKRNIGLAHKGLKYKKRAKAGLS